MLIFFFFSFFLLLPWKNHIINEATLGSRERVRKFGDIVLLSFDLIVRVSKDNFDSALGTHDSNFTRGPCNAIRRNKLILCLVPLSRLFHFRRGRTWKHLLHITTQMLGSHDIVGTTIGLSGNDSKLWNSCFAVGIQ